ncbi:hypothetical protein K8T06_08565 [bacterium]|nr:hypothetical protein [bacterium]
MNDQTKTKNKNNISQNKILKMLRNLIAGGWITAYQDLMSGFVQPFQKLDSIMLPGIIVLVSTIITWFIYVPIHELFHVGGCVFTGGTVSELVMGHEYGAAYLQNFFPFITPATTQYAGRVTGFEPNGDLGYMITVFAPFLLTLFPGVWFLKKVYTKQKTWLLGPGIVMGLASFYNLTGDYFEMGTILSTRLVNLLLAGQPANLFENFWLLRSDDIFRLFGEIYESPTVYGMDTGLGIIATVSVIVIGFILAVSMAGWTYQLGRRIAGFSSSSPSAKA